MEKYEKKIKVNLSIVTIPAPFPGLKDSVKYVNDKDIYLPFVLKQDVKDLGVYTDYVEKTEIIDLGNFWQTSNNGSGDFGNNPISSGVDGGYGNGVDGSETLVTGDGTFTVYGCTDPTAINYNSNATVDNGSCDTGSIVITTTDTSTDPTGQGIESGGCMELSSGYIGWDSENYPNPLSQPYDGFPNFIDYARFKAIQWCKAVHPSCGNPYTISNTCNGNICGDTICCPGPPNTHHLLTSQECSDLGLNCSGSDCSCDGTQPLFSDIKITYQTSNGNSVNYFWKFYCIPD